MKIYTTQEILNKLDWCIRYKMPFSHIRLGDGGIKFLHSILFKDLEQLDIIVKKEGLPSYKIIEIFELWGYYTRQADFIDTPEVYYNDTFWPRVKKPNKPINPETDQKLRIWKYLYNNSEIFNENYCNPESNCLFILDIPGRRNIFDLMKDRKVCIICARPEVKHSLYNYDVDIVEIVGQYEKQYNVSFRSVVEVIKNTARKYDFWIIAAGELGRIYTGMIKEFGGRAVDIGFVIDYWVDGYIHPRFHQFLSSSLNNKLELRLTDQGKEFLESI
jgi:hypothetical protein